MIIDLRNGSSKDDDCIHEIEYINKLISDMEAEIKRDKFMPHFLYPSGQKAGVPA
jgi:hypothetical protein